MSGVAVALVLFGVMNAWLSRFAGTCTQGSADQLAGLALVLLSYSLSLALLWRAVAGRLVLISLGLMLPVLTWHAAEGIRFAWGVWVRGQSACSLLVGPGHGIDGRESGFAALWVLAAVVVPVLGGWRLWRNHRVGA